MKRSILFAAVLCLVSAASAQTVKIIKDGQTIAVYNLSDIDKVIFEPAADEDLANQIAGVYDANREVTLPAMEQMGILVSDRVQINVSASGSATVDVTLPECQYTMNGYTFTLPAATIAGATVSKDGDNYTITGLLDGEIDGKSAKIDLSASINADGSFVFVEDMLYGTMPMVLHFVYTSTQE